MEDVQMGAAAVQTQPSHEAWLEETLTTAQAAAFLTVTPNFLARKRTEGGGPLFKKFGQKTIRYRRKDLIDYRDSMSRRSTSEAAPAAATDS